MLFGVPELLVVVGEYAKSEVETSPALQIWARLTRINNTPRHFSQARRARAVDQGSGRPRERSPVLGLSLRSTIFQVKTKNIHRRIDRGPTATPRYRHEVNRTPEK